MSRILTPAGDEGAIPDAVPCLALPNSSAALQLPPETKGGLLSLLTLAELLEGQAEDGRCKEVRAAIDGNDKSRFREDPNGPLVRTAPLDGAAQVYAPTHMRYGAMMREHYPPQAGHPGANKMYTSMRRWFYWESMVVDVHAFVADCTQCARNRVGKRRKTNYIKTFPSTEPLTDLCMDLLVPLPRKAAGNEHLLVIVDRFSKMTRAIPLQRIDAETIAAAFLDNWMAAFGPSASVLSDNGPQLRSTFFQEVCSLLGISNRYFTTYHPQTNDEVERYNRTIVGQMQTYVKDHQDRWNELLSMLTLAYNSRPQQSTGVAPLEFVTPVRVRSLSVEQMVGSPTPEETDGSPPAIREVIRARLRDLIHTVRRSLALAQRRYKSNCDARVRPVNREVDAGDWVFVDGHTRTKYKLGTGAAGPYKALSRGEGTLSLDIGGYPETVRSDHVTAAPGSPGDPQTLLHNLGVPQDIVVPEGHQHTGKEFVSEAFVGHDYLAGNVVFKLRIVADSRLQHVSRSEPRGRGGDRLYRMAGWKPSPGPGGKPRRSDRMDGLGGQAVVRDG